MDGSYPLVSVIVALRNGADYLPTCMESLFSQTFSDFEILLCVSTSSTDASVELCTSYASQDDRVRVVARDDLGLGDARNGGMDQARGKYIAFVDVDDTVEPEFLEQMVRPLEETTADLVACGFDRRWRDGTVKPYWIPQSEGLVDVDFTEYCHHVSIVTVWIKLYRREWLEQYQLYQPPGIQEDSAWHLMIAARVRRVYLLPRVLYHYTVDNNQSLMQDERKVAIAYFKSAGFASEDLASHGLLEANRTRISTIARGMERYFKLQFPEDSRIEEAADALYAKYFPWERAWQEAERASLHRDSGTGGVVLFGCGRDGKQALRRIGKDRVLAFVDNNEKLYGKKVEGIPVMGLEECRRRYPDAEVIVASSKYLVPIVEQLFEAGCTKLTTPETYEIRERFAVCQRHIVLVNPPLPSVNAGHHVIVMRERAFFARWFPDFDVIEMDGRACLDLRWQLKELIGPQDIIVLTGGEYLASLGGMHGSQPVCNAIHDFPDNLIAVFPQTLSFEDNGYGRQNLEVSRRVYPMAHHLIVFLRERDSYERACRLMGSSVDYRWAPDFVLDWRIPAGRVAANHKVALCQEKDSETQRPSEDMAAARQMLAAKGWHVEGISMDVEAVADLSGREWASKRKLHLLRQFEAVVTDDVYAMMFCAVGGVPCVALDDWSGSVSGVYEWIRQLPYITLARSAEEAGEKLGNVLGQDRACTLDVTSELEGMAKFLRGRYEALMREMEKKQGGGSIEG